MPPSGAEGGRVRLLQGQRPASCGLNWLQSVGSVPPPASGRRGAAQEAAGSTVATGAAAKRRRARKQWQWQRQRQRQQRGHEAAVARQTAHPPPAASYMRRTTTEQEAQWEAASEEEAKAAEREEEPEQPPLASMIVVGSFSHPTRTRTAESEILEVIGDLGLPHLFVDFAPAAPTCKVIRMQLCSFDAVTEMCAAFRGRNIQTAHSAGPLWAQRARTAEEAARAAPVARGVRILRDHLEQVGERNILVEGHYRRGEEGIYMTTDNWENEHFLVIRSQSSGSWMISADIWPRMGVQGTAEKWLASLL